MVRRTHSVTRHPLLACSGKGAIQVRFKVFHHHLYEVLTVGDSADFEQLDSVCFTCIVSVKTRV